MTRPAARPPASIQQGPPAPHPNPPPPAGGGQGGGPAAPAEAPKAGGLSPGWRVALFVWATAFVFLLIYELLTTLVLSLRRLF